MSRITHPYAVGNHLDLRTGLAGFRARSTGAPPRAGCRRRFGWCRPCGRNPCARCPLGPIEGSLIHALRIGVSCVWLARTISRHRAPRESTHATDPNSTPWRSDQKCRGRAGRHACAGHRSGRGRAGKIRGTPIQSAFQADCRSASTTQYKSRNQPDADGVPLTPRSRRGGGSVEGDACGLEARSQAGEFDRLIAGEGHGHREDTRITRTGSRLQGLSEAIQASRVLKQDSGLTPVKTSSRALALRVTIAGSVKG